MSILNISTSKKPLVSITHFENIHDENLQQNKNFRIKKNTGNAVSDEVDDSRRFKKPFRIFAQRSHM